MKFPFRSPIIILGIVLAVLLVIGTGIFFFRSSGGGTLKEDQKLPASITLKTFQGKNPPFDFTFEYPVAWKEKVRDLKGRLEMVQVTGPQDPVTKVIPGIFVRIQEMKGSDSLETIAEVFPNREQRFGDFKQLYNAGITIGGVAARRLEYQYILKLPMRSKIAKDTLLKRGEIFILRKQKLYQISFWMTEEQHKIYRPVLEHILVTFKFLG